MLLCGHQVPRLEKRCYFNKSVLDPGRDVCPFFPTAPLPLQVRVTWNSPSTAEGPKVPETSDGSRGLGRTHVICVHVHDVHTCVVPTYMVYVYVILCTLIL